MGTHRGNDGDVAAGVILTHWGRVTHICVCKLTIIGSDNGLLPSRRQDIIWTNAVQSKLLEIYTFPLKKMHLNISSRKWRPFCLGFSLLCGCDFKCIHFNLGIVIMNIQVSITLEWMPENLIDEILFEYWFKHITIRLLCVKYIFSTRIFYWGIPGFATDCPWGVWCRGLLTICLPYVGPLLGN